MQAAVAHYLTRPLVVREMDRRASGLTISGLAFMAGERLAAFAKRGEIGGA